MYSAKKLRNRQKLSTVCDGESEGSINIYIMNAML